MPINKGKIVRCFLAHVRDWNHEFHIAIESDVIKEFKDTFHDSKMELSERETILKGMRSFYYMRMTNTAMMLLAAASVAVSAIALIISTIALTK